MSTANTEFESMLREAVTKAIEAAPRAVNELIGCASKVAEAVAAVTGQFAVLELVPLEHEVGSMPTYQLQLSKHGSDAPPSDLGIYQLTAAGYPILHWYSQAKWLENPETPEKQYDDVAALESSFKWMLSDPESRLVMLVTFFSTAPCR